MNLAPGDDGQRLVEQARERLEDVRLGLPPQAEEDEVVARQHRVDDLGNDGVVVADDARKERPADAQARHEVLATSSRTGRRLTRPAATAA